jgi:peptide/nickel transport system substrate-binding protein
MQSWGANAPESDPKQIFHSDSIKDQGDNFGQWNSPRADAAIDAARKEMDADKRAGLWHEFERVMHEEEPWTWVRVQPYTRIIKPEIGNVQMYAKGIEYYELYRASRALPMRP